MLDATPGKQAAHCRRSGQVGARLRAKDATRLVERGKGSPAEKISHDRNPSPFANRLGGTITAEDSAMPRRFIRYRVKQEKIEENQRLIEEVFRELHAKSPAGVRYLVLKLSDGTFCHLVEDGSKTIPNLDAFAAFQRGGKERRLDEPQQLEATIVGNYRTLTEA
jgi:hypothetical protein